MTNPSESTNPEPTTPEPTNAEESAWNGRVDGPAADGAPTAVSAQTLRMLEELFEDPTTSGGQQLIALRSDFAVSAEKLFRRNLPPKSVLALDEEGELGRMAVLFCLRCFGRDY